MIENVISVAKDVDLLFRARQDGLQMPVGINKKNNKRPWTPCEEEHRAMSFALWLSGQNAASRGDRTNYRTRRHVSALALLEPKHFRQCLAKANLITKILFLKSSEEAPPPLMKIVQRGSGFSLISFEYPQTKTLDDIRRTAIYLRKLDTSLTQFREAEAEKAAITARKKQIAKDRKAAKSKARRQARPIPEEDEAAILQIY